MVTLPCILPPPPQGVIAPPFKLLLGPLEFSTWTGPVWPNLTYPDFEVVEVREGVGERCGPT